MKKVLVTCHMGRHYRKFGHYDIKVLQELGYEVHFAANFNLEIDKVDKNSEIILHQIDFERSPFSLKNIKAYKQLKQLFKENNFDMVHCQSPVGGVLTRLAARKYRKLGMKVIYTAHGFHFYKGAPLINWLLFYPIEKWLARYTDILITINKEDYELAKNKFKTNVKFVSGVGIQPEKFDVDISDEEKMKLRKSLGLKKEDFVMIYPAELNKNKNQIMLINVMEKLVEKYSNIKLLLPGKDSYNGKYQKIVKEKKLDNNIIFLGFRSDIPKLLKISNLAVSASLREGLPVNLLEDMYIGLPIIATNCRGNRDLIDDNINGFLVEQGDLNKFKECVEKIYLNKIDIDAMCKNAKIKVKKYLINNIVDDMKKIFINV